MHYDNKFFGICGRTTAMTQPGNQNAASHARARPSRRARLDRQHPRTPCKLAANAQNSVAKAGAP
eukprot:11198539-Lingulodinium_polyedra.AAC.1